MVLGKVALVTGGGSGIGRATCQVLARYGAKVVVTDINKAGAEETVKSLSGEGHMSLFLDVANKKSIEDCITAIKAQYQGPPTICVNNAGILNVNGLLDHTDEIIDNVIAVNLKGTVYTTKAVCRELVAAKLPGSIINLSSMAIKGTRFGAVYAGTKGAVKSFSKSIAKEFGKYGIRCNIIVPGNINTPMADIVDVMYPDFVEQLIQSLAINRKGKPEEVGEAIAFLASEKSSYMTGACLYVDGGI